MRNITWMKIITEIWLEITVLQDMTYWCYWVYQHDLYEAIWTKPRVTVFLKTKAIQQFSFDVSKCLGPCLKEFVILLYLITGDCAHWLALRQQIKNFLISRLVYTLKNYLRLQRAFTNFGLYLLILITWGINIEKN